MMLLSGCSTTKSKDEQGKFKKFYHNTTSKYNGFFNAKEIMSLTMNEMDELHQDNYNKILPVYNYTELENPKSITPELDKAIEKVITVATIHDLSNYVDDCYVLMGQAQYLKQDYASAEETFQYFEEQFDPKNPYGREYTKAKTKTAKEKKKELEAKKKEAKKEREEEQKLKDEEREKQKKAREEESKRRKNSSKKSKKGKKTSADRAARNAAKAAAEKAKPKKLTKEEKEAAKAAEAAQKEKEDFEKEKAKLREAEEELKRNATRPQGEGGIFENKTAYYQGLYWLARTYIERDRFTAANYLLDRLEGTSPLEEEVAKKIPAARAHLFLRSGEEDAALVALQSALEKEDDKQLKARYAFIRAQLYEAKNNTALAYDEYRIAKKYSPDYEMKFNAELNELKLSYRTGNIGRDKVDSRLNKMLKEEKNEPFADQIFFTMAQVKLDAGEIDGAITDFESAIQATGGNKNVKQEAYYKLAELLFQEGYYSDAKKNYDNTLKSMSVGDERYKKVQRLAENLKDIANNIDIIELQDSLIGLSLKSDDELNKFAEEELTKRAEENKNNPKATKRNVLRPGGNNFASVGRSNFFAYNPIAQKQGQLEFKRIWKDRVLEDNWRRSLRTDANTDSGQNADAENEKEITITQDEIDAFLREVPRSETQKKSADIKIQNALFNLGIQFRDRLRNHEKAVEVLERLIDDYPQFEKRDEALFYLYLSHDELGNNTASQLALNKLKSEYPNSKFTKLATDPSYASTLRSGEDSIEQYYETTYSMFENGDYATVLERVQQKAKLFDQKEDEYDAKFDLLQAMSYGSIEGKQRYIKELQSLIKRHKGTPEEVRAKEILRFLNGDSTAFNEILYEEGVDKFTRDDDKLHYVFAVVYGQSKNLQSIKIAVSDYNKKYHRTEKLSTTNITLSPTDDSQIILIRSFDDKVKAMEYLNGIKKNEDKFLNKPGRDPIGYDLFAATQKNYRELVKQRTVSAYREFFKVNYER